MHLHTWGLVCIGQWWQGIIRQLLDALKRPGFLRSKGEEWICRVCATLVGTYKGGNEMSSLLLLETAALTTDTNI